MTYVTIKDVILSSPASVAWNSFLNFAERGSKKNVLKCCIRKMLDESTGDWRYIYALSMSGHWLAYCPSHVTPKCVKALPQQQCQT
jgi:hypothetical protein